MLPTLTGGKPINYHRDFAQGSQVSWMRNRIGDIFAGPGWTPFFQAAVKRTLLAFLATLPPTAIYHHIGVWQVVQHRRQFGNCNYGFMAKTVKAGEVGVHDIVASRMLLYCG